MHVYNPPAPPRKVNGLPPRSNVIPLRPRVPIVGDPFKALTRALILQQHRAGTLQPAVLEALLTGVGLP
jgi:hypothetical protein